MTNDRITQLEADLQQARFDLATSKGEIDFKDNTLKEVIDSAAAVLWLGIEDTDEHKRPFLNIIRCAAYGLTGDSVKADEIVRAALTEYPTQERTS
jgi:hypothetical protein